MTKALSGVGVLGFLANKEENHDYQRQGFNH